MSELQQINIHLPTIVERIVSHFQSLQIILFGSYGTGTATKHSDIDLLVVFPEVEHSVNQAIAVRQILVTSPEEIREYGHLVGTILKSALKEGKVIYEQEDSLDINHG